MFTLVATLAFAAAAATAAYVPAPTPSLVACNSTTAAVKCSYMYKPDPKIAGSTLRCKPRQDSKQACSAAYCCVPMPDFVPCASKWANVTCPYASYKPDPKNSASTLPCRVTPVVGGAYIAPTNMCNAATCCAPPPSIVSCSAAPVKCPAGYNKDPKTGGVMRCKTRADSSITCNEKTCCANPIVY